MLSTNGFVLNTLSRYGDKTVHSIAGRMFGMIWIMMGIVIMSIFTATLSAAFTSATSTAVSNDIRGTNVSLVSK